MAQAAGNAFGRSSRWVRTIAVLAIVAMTLTGCRLAASSGQVTGHATGGSSVKVPNVIGKRLSDAQNTLKSAGLTNATAVDGTGRGRIVLDPDNWVVMSQAPAAGTTVAKGTKETLKVRRPSDTTTTPKTTLGVIPDVTCLNLQDAQNDLQDAGFFNLGSQDGSGQGRMQILDRDWVVIQQSVPAGSRTGLTKRVVLTSVKYGESTGKSGCKS